MKTALLHSPLAAGLLVSTLVFLGVLGLRSTGSLAALELAAYDWYLRLRPEPELSDSRIVLITVTEADIRNQGRWPLTDATLAQALEILSRYQPRAIGVDLHRDVPVPPGREALEAILTKVHNVIVAEKFGHGAELGIPPPSVLENTDQVGFNDIVVDPGGIVRRGLLFLDDGEHVSYAFALRLALLYLQAEGITPQPDASDPQHIRLGHATIRPLASNDGGYVGADTRGYQFLLDFREARRSFPSFPLTTLLSEEIAPKAIKDKIVLVGVVAESVKDFFYTPYSQGLYVKQQIPGIALHAHIVNQLLRAGLEDNATIATMGEWHEGCWILLWSVLGSALGLWVRSPWRFLLLATSGLLTLSLVVYCAFLRGWWIPLVPPTMTWLISATILTAYMANQEKGQRALLMQLFAKHVSPEIAETVWQQREQFLRGGRPRSQELMVTVLFSDLKGFTAASEQMNPQTLMDWLNTYAETMSQLIIEHGGVIDNYVGDGLMADFGVPLARTTEAEIGQDAKNAVRCALAMERELNRLNVLWQEQHLPTVAMRIGIFTGPVVAGSLGSAQRLKYTIIGDTVNIASRLESFDKDLVDQDPPYSPCRILIGEATLQYLDQQFKTQRIGEVSLKGKEQKITVYRVVGGEEASPNEVS
jgi:adenylate cyclase